MVHYLGLEGVRMCKYILSLPVDPYGFTICTFYSTWNYAASCEKLIWN